MMFQQAAVDKEGKEAFAVVFRRPPISTQQILHPDKYFAGVKPALPDLPKPADTRGYKGLIGGTFGELDHQVLLEQFAGKATAENLAPHWRGGQYELMENRKKKQVILLYASQWDTARAARLYFMAYRKALAGKWKKMEVTSETGDTLKGRGDDGDFVLKLDGAVVTSMEGLEPEMQASATRSDPAGVRTSASTPAESRAGQSRW
jgi:hypothetical protein